MKTAIIAGGTVAYLYNHLAIASPAYGTTGADLKNLIPDADLYLTKMAGGHVLETPADIDNLIKFMILPGDYRVVYFPVAMVDYYSVKGSKTKQRPREEKLSLELVRTNRVISKIRATRKDIFLVGFKQTHNCTELEQYRAGLTLLKETSCNLVLANDTATRLNMIVAPEETQYSVTYDRAACLQGLVKMVNQRATNHFTRTVVRPGELVSYDTLPTSFQKVLDYCIHHGAYKPFRSATAGHFAVKIGPTTFLTSPRKKDFNLISGMVQVDILDDTRVSAIGTKPSVGGQSQRIIFEEHPEMDCIIHFHCPIKYGSDVPVVPQWPYECGSHECGQNTSQGLKQFGNLKAVYLDNHGPNIVFNSKIDPQEVMDFIDTNFDLGQKTGGIV